MLHHRKRLSVISRDNGTDNDEYLADANYLSPVQLRATGGGGYVPLKHNNPSLFYGGCRGKGEAIL